MSAVQCSESIMRKTSIASLLLTCSLAAQGTGLVLQNGVDAHFDVPYSPILLPRSGITIEAWVK